MEILVLGARGGLGRLVCDELRAAGHRVRTVEREAMREVDTLVRAADGTGAIVNCAGASVALGFGKGWRGYGAVDTRIGLVAAGAAKRLGIRLVYVGVHHPPALASCAYVAAHERVAAAMRELDGVVVRATGFYSAFAALLPLAQRGVLVDVGAGRARTNPIDERDLAAVVAEGILGASRELSVGGPEVLTRAEIFEQVAAAAGGRVRVLRVPAWLGGAGAAALRLVHPRIGQFGRFAALLARHDVIAPARGMTRLAAYLDAVRACDASVERSLPGR